VIFLAAASTTHTRARSPPQRRSRLTQGLQLTGFLPVNSQLRSRGGIPRLRSCLPSPRNVLLVPAAETQSVMQTGKVLACRSGNAIPVVDFSSSGSEGELRAQTVGLKGCAAACDGSSSRACWRCWLVPRRRVRGPGFPRASRSVRTGCLAAARIGGLRPAVLASGDVLPGLPAKAWHVAPSSRSAPPSRGAAAVKTIVPRRRERLAACPGRLSRAAWTIGPSSRAEWHWRSSRDLFPFASVVLPCLSSSRSGLTGCSISARSCWYRRLGFRPRPSAGPPVPDIGLSTGHGSRVVASGKAARIGAASQMPRFRFFVTHATGRAPVGVVPMVVPRSRVRLRMTTISSCITQGLQQTGSRAGGLRSQSWLSPRLRSLQAAAGAWSDGPAAEARTVRQTRV
jgi:hypothetical protein